MEVRSLKSGIGKLNYQSGMVQVRVDMSGWIRALNQLDRVARAVTTSAIARGVEDIGRKAWQEALQESGVNSVTGNLYNALRVETSAIKRLKGEDVIVRIDSPYAYTLNYGSGPYREDFGSLFRWVKKTGKARAEGRAPEDVAMAIWKKFYNEGRPAKGFIELFLQKFRMRVNILMRYVSSQWKATLGRMEEVEETKVFDFGRLFRGRAVETSLRGMLYDLGKTLGDLESIGISIPGLRTGIYGAARGIGDISAVTSISGAGGRIFRRSLGKELGSQGIKSMMSLPRAKGSEGAIISRAQSRVSGAFSGKTLRVLER